MLDDGERVCEKIVRNLVTSFMDDPLRVSTRRISDLL